MNFAARHASIVASYYRAEALRWAGIVALIAAGALLIIGAVALIITQ